MTKEPSCPLETRPGYSFPATTEGAFVPLGTQTGVLSPATTKEAFVPFGNQTGVLSRTRAGGLSHDRHHRQIYDR